MIKSESMKKVCFFGIYDREYPRNKVIIRGFEENGFEVIHCNVNPKEVKGFKKYQRLFEQARKLNGHTFQFVWVAFPGHTCVGLARLLFPKNQLIYDIFVSQYEANVLDRKVHHRLSLAAFKDWFLDWHSLKFANIVTLDTNEQINMFSQKYGLNKTRAIRIFLSSALPLDPQPLQSRGDSCLVHFHGSFIPLHGVEYIIRAAKLLANEKNITFRLVGGGQQLGEMKELAQKLQLSNIEFTGRLQDYNEVLNYLKNADVMLGMFASSGRGHLVIPNKIFEGMVYGKAILSADTPAMHELFIDRENVLLCKPGDPRDLAEKILELKRDIPLRAKIGLGALELFKKELAPQKLIANFLEEINQKI